MNRIQAIAIVLLGLGIGMNGEGFLEPQTVAAKAGVETVEGVVMMAGNSRLMITPDSGDIVELAVAPTARIVRDGEVTELDGLHAKDHVHVMFTGNGQDRLATDIIARSPR